MFNLPLVHGHRIAGQVFAFPHRCPGADCAIAEFLFRKSLLNQMERRKAASEDYGLALTAAPVIQETPSGAE